MKVSSLINFLIDFNNCDSFLEIRHNGTKNSLKSIRCNVKKIIYHDGNQFIDPNENSSFFNTSRYKFIFITGTKGEEYTQESLELALSILKKGGLLAIKVSAAKENSQESLNPENENHLDSGSWKAILNTFNSSPYVCQIIDLPEPFVLIDTSQKQVPQKFISPSPSDINGYPFLPNSLRISIEAFLQSKVAVFYHLACMGNWTEVFDEQMFQLGSNGFTKISLCILGSRSDRAFALSIAKKYNIEVSIVFFDSDLNHFEIQAILAVEKYAQSNKGFVLYLHSKGVSEPQNITKIKWRHVMMRELVLNWENCMKNILDYDLIGVNWIDMEPLSHFSGNFWYASTKYLKTLTNFKNYYYNPADLFTDRAGKRIRCETWIGSYNRKPKILVLKYRNIRGKKWLKTLVSEVHLTTIKR